MTLLIGFTGKAGAGKDTAASYVKATTNFGFEIMKFAQPLKDMLIIGLGLSHEQVEGSLKEVIDERYGCTPRRLMQTLGTEWGRDLISRDLWPNILKNNAEGKRVLITDCRFESEAEIIREAGGFIVHVISKDVTTEHHSHPSENGIQFKTGDWSVENLGTFEELNNQLDILIKNKIKPLIDSIEKNQK